MLAPPEDFASRGLLAGRRLAITAAAGTGIGFATARRCLEEGASVVISDRHERRLKETEERLRGDFPESVHSITCDVTRSAEVDSFIDGAWERLGSLDVLVNNAGLGFTQQLADTEDEDWQRVIDVSLTGTFRCMRSALRRMREVGSGVIVNVGSVTARRAEVGQSAYAAAKAGVLALTRCAALEAVSYGVRVNAVVPTIALHEHLSKVADADYLAEAISWQPQGRAADPREIANAIVFLASDLASYMVGESLSISDQSP